MSEDKTARIDGVLYDWCELPSLAQEILETISFIDRKLNDFENEKRIFELARSNFLSVLKESLPDDHGERKMKQDQEGTTSSDAAKPPAFGDLDLSNIIDQWSNN